MPEKLKMVATDPWLEPVEGELLYRRRLYLDALERIERGSGSIVDYANGYRYYGFQRDDERRGWWFREWLPNAHDVYLFGDFNDWNRHELRLHKGSEGIWSTFLADELYASRLVHGSLVKLLIKGANGEHERIPTYIRRAVQNDQTKDFTGQFWNPAPFDWGDDKPVVPPEGQLLIYECHVGMATEREGVGSYAEFTERILPRIKELGYSAVQLMAVAEHPYYGSFGYHVSNFFAASSRFGTPEELKALIKRAHELGLCVIMDLVHSHYVKNLNEGLNLLDGTDLYSPPGEGGDHPHWDSKLFDYARPGVEHFLLSNVKFWLDEFHFDGYRFDGVTSMAFHHHGYTEFDAREKFFDDSVNRSALIYLTLANRLVHDFRPQALTIAEDVSGMPGMCFPIGDGGIGFDYRLGMAIPDFWIKLLKEVPDEQWNIWQMWQIMTDRLPQVGTIAYAESHDQALVGDKTIAFRLMDKQMYFAMHASSEDLVVERGMALHKMIRLFTIALGGQGYLTFMGNEFGHPEWIDFPREGNTWSYAHARRQWSLASNPELRFRFLEAFDRAMVGFVRRNNILGMGYAWQLQMDPVGQTIVFHHERFVFVFNWHPSHSTPDYRIPVPMAGKYRPVLSTDWSEFGGHDSIAHDSEHFSAPAGDGHTISIYNVCRTATIYTIQD